MTGTIAAVGIVCGFIGAVIGAVGWDKWKKEEMQQQHHSRSGYITYSRVKVRVFVCCWPVVESLSWELCGS